MERVWHKHYDPQVPRTIECPDECLPLFVQKNALNLPHNIATEFFGAKLTYASLWNHILSFANALSLLGVEPGKKVAIMLPNCPQAIIAYYATLWLGGVVVMTNPLYVERELEFNGAMRKWNLRLFSITCIQGLKKSSLISRSKRLLSPA